MHRRSLVLAAAKFVAHARFVGCVSGVLRLAKSGISQPITK